MLNTFLQYKNLTVFKNYRTQKPLHCSKQEHKPIGVTLETKSVQILLLEPSGTCRPRLRISEDMLQKSLGQVFIMYTMFNAK